MFSPEPLCVCLCRSVSLQAAHAAFELWGQNMLLTRLWVRLAPGSPGRALRTNPDLALRPRGGRSVTFGEIPPREMLTQRNRGRWLWQEVGEGLHTGSMMFTSYTTDVFIYSNILKPCLIKVLWSIKLDPSRCTMVRHLRSNEQKRVTAEILDVYFVLFWFYSISVFCNFFITFSHSFHLLKPISRFWFYLCDFSLRHKPLRLNTFELPGFNMQPLLPSSPGLSFCKPLYWWSNLPWDCTAVSWVLCVLITIFSSEAIQPFSVLQSSGSRPVLHSFCHGRGAPAHECVMWNLKHRRGGVWFISDDIWRRGNTRMSPSLWRGLLKCSSVDHSGKQVWGLWTNSCSFGFSKISRTRC